MRMKNHPYWGKYSNHRPNAIKDLLHNSCNHAATQPLLDVIQSLELWKHKQSISNHQVISCLITQVHREGTFSKLSTLLSSLDLSGPGLCINQYELSSPTKGFLNYYRRLTNMHDWLTKISSNKNTGGKISQNHRWWLFSNVCSLKMYLRSKAENIISFFVF